MFVDSHCHINFEGLAERLPEVLANMREQQVTHALCVSVDLETLPAVLDIAERHDNVFASVGVHPDHEDVKEPTLAELVELAAHPKVVAIGETGSTTTGSASARLPTWSGSASGFAPTSAPRARP